MHVTEYENTVNIIDARFCLLIFFFFDLMVIECF